MDSDKGEPIIPGQSDMIAAPIDIDARDSGCNCSLTSPYKP